MANGRGSGSGQWALGHVEGIGLPDPWGTSLSHRDAVLTILQGEPSNSDETKEQAFQYKFCYKSFILEDYFKRGNT